MQKLADKQELFVREYVVDFNGTQAAIRAGYSKRGATTTAHKLLQKGTVSSRIRHLAKERIQRIETDAGYVHAVLREIVDRATAACEVLGAGERHRKESQD